ncbi:Ig-like domain-containing protein [Sansalvadorimonas sp. 2012CJ34-2]|uniref:Ig-like domain-containing protein n=1 Tax=Parendozoicomonas callyspongiae TaxID=2942213 RepID=A0ABT0PAX8_9GAMM|nr:VCBS domain-containing protein [Sansalvadorimonas sp. 2012CJ34-2]MCL6268386.1 Ig-like domain-containing protein [Sansalvadorimonas sp. 2012CJ34-2]
MAKVLDVNGHVELIEPDGSVRIIQAGDDIEPQQLIRTGLNSNASLILPSGEVLRLPSGSNFQLPGFDNLSEKTKSLNSSLQKPSDFQENTSIETSLLRRSSDEIFTSDLNDSKNESQEGGSLQDLSSFGKTHSLQREGLGLDNSGAPTSNVQSDVEKNIVEPLASTTSSNSLYSGFQPQGAYSNPGTFILGSQVQTLSSSFLNTDSFFQAISDSSWARYGKILNQQTGILSNDIGEGLVIKHIGNVPLADDGSATIQGDFGTLTIQADGSYSYSAFDIDLYSDLVAFWDFNQSNASRVVDDRSGMDSTNNIGLLGSRSKVVGGGITGNTLDGRISVEQSVELNVPNDGGIEERSVSLSFQLESQTGQGGRQVLFQEGNQTTGLVIYIHDGTLYAGAYNGSGWSGHFFSADISSFNAGDWHNITLSLDGHQETMVAWLDGTRLGQAPGQTLDDHNGDLHIGGSSNSTFRFHDGNHTGSFGFDGLIDNVRVYNRSIGDFEARVLGNTSGSITDQFSYTAQNAAGETVTSTLNISLQASDNTAPVAEDDALSVIAGQSALVNSVRSSGLLGNDRDQDDDSLSVTEVAGTSIPDSGTVSIVGQYGTLIVSADGTYTYTSNNGVSGGVTDVFSYTVSDGTTTSRSTLSVNVIAQGAANADSLTITESPWSASTIFDASYDSDTSSSDLLAIDIITGTTHNLGVIQGMPEPWYLDLAMSASGSLYAVDSKKLYTVNPDTLMATEIGDHGVLYAGSWEISGITASPDGTIYMLDSRGVISTINPTTGQATTAASLADLGYRNEYVGDITWHDGALYLTSSNYNESGTVIENRYFIRADVTGSDLTLTALPSERNKLDIHTMASINGELVAIGFNGQAVTVNTQTGGLEEYLGYVSYENHPKGGAVIGMRTMTGNVLDNDTNPQSVNAITLSDGTSRAVTSHGTTIRGIFGILTIKSDGSYQYRVDDRLDATNNLASGETGNDRFTYTLTDTNGQISQSILTVYVNGTDEVDVAESSLLTSSITMESVNTDSAVPVDFLAQTPDDFHKITEIRIIHHNGIVFDIPEVLTASGAITGNTSDSSLLVWTATPGSNAGLDVFNALSSGLSYTMENGDFLQGVWMEIHTTTSKYDASGNLTDSLPAVSSITTNYVGIDHARIGTSGDDTLTGSSVSWDYHDEFIGGAGNDTMTGGDGSDFFVWSVEDVGTQASPATDTITDFRTKGSGDVLDLRDLLPENASDNLDQFLSFSFAGGDTTIGVSTSAGGPVVQNIVLDGVDLSAYFGTSNAAQLANLLSDQGNLLS